ncbi:MAG: DMT family protein [Spirochaetes bacterium]|nr:DMT family protein [Spirochaetota bacterium]MBX3724126.1 DMT family protein [Turneriella sp.]
MSPGLSSIALLVLSNVFMTLAWYGHLQLHKSARFSNLPLYAVILVSWLIALVEYAFQVPANRIGSENYGGPFNLFELKVIQEVVSLVVFTIFAVWVFRSDELKWNYLVGFGFLVLAVFFIFKKW